MVGSPVRPVSYCASMAGSSRLLRVGSGQPKAEPEAAESYKIVKFRCFAQLCLPYGSLGCWGRERKAMGANQSALVRVSFVPFPSQPAPRQAGGVVLSET